MSFVSGGSLSVAPEALRAASTAVQTIKARAVEIESSAAPVTTGVVPPALDAVSARAAEYLVKHAQEYKQIIAQAATVLDDFATALSNSATAYTTADTDNGKTIAD